MYGSEPVGYDQYVGMLKGYHAAFDNIKYTADNWLPGTGEDGSLDGSVRTYGTWTGTNVSTGKELNLKGYWYMNFDDKVTVTVLAFARKKSFEPTIGLKRVPDGDFENCGLHPWLQ